MAPLATAAMFCRTKMDLLRGSTLCLMTLTKGHNRNFNYPLFSHKVTQCILNVTFIKGQAKMWDSFKISTC